jgi:hypothetical protein
MAVPASAVLLVVLASLSVASNALTGQAGSGVITVVYGNETKVPVQDWHFVYEFLESDTPLDPAHVATCTRPSPDRNSCPSQLKTSKDLFILAPLPGPSAAAQVPFLLPGSTLQVIFLHWKESPGTYEEGGVRLNPNRNNDGHASNGLTIVTTQGAQIRIPGALRVPESFLSSTKHVYLMKLSLAGTVQVQGMPGRFELRLDSPLVPSSLNERVEEIQFRSGPEPTR